MFPISIKALSDKERHDYILNNYVLNKAAHSESRKYKRDIDVIKEHHRFLWDEAADDSAGCDTWEERLARRYYNKLFKEYCIADLTRYKENKIAMRWRTEAEVVAGIGQFQCGSRKCENKCDLRSWEVNFAYLERGEKKNALVKLRLCPTHSEYLNYTSKKREFKRLKRTDKKSKHLSKKSHKIRDSASIQTTANDLIPNSSIQMDDIAAEEAAIAVKEPVASAEEDSIHNVWNSKQLVDLETNNRENEFEQYLEDLLL